jgi:hypothetical protein
LRLSGGICTLFRHKLPKIFPSMLVFCPASWHHHSCTHLALPGPLQVRRMGSRRLPQIRKLSPLPCNYPKLVIKFLISDSPRLFPLR